MLEPRKVKYCSVCLCKIKQKCYYSCEECYDLACCQTCYLISQGNKENFPNERHSQTHSLRVVAQQENEEEGAAE